MSSTLPSRPKPPTLTPSSFASAQLPLLASELAAETTHTSTLLSTTSPKILSRAGLAVINLTITSQRTGLGGRTVLDLQPDPALTDSTKDSGTHAELPAHDIRPGDVVRVGPQPKGGEAKRDKAGLEKGGVTGVVVRVWRTGLGVAVDEDAGRQGAEGAVDGPLAEARLWVVKLANEVTYRRMNWTMERMRDMEEGGWSLLMRVLFGQGALTPVGDVGEGDVEWVDPGLNESQKGAVRFALKSREVALIHGPPGTGKTYTLIELILQMLKKGLRVLVCGPSNISVDNIVERLAPHKVPMVRLGHPARLLPGVLNHSLDVLTQTSEAAGLVKDIRKEMDAKQASIKKTKSGRERKAIYGEIRELRKEFRERERKCISTLVGSSKVVLATLHGAGSRDARQEKFDVVIIDEASQALEAQCWIPLLTANKVVLAGDHLQLPPTIKSLDKKTKETEKKVKDVDKRTKKTDDKQSGSNEAVPKLTLETTLFDRLLGLHGPSIKHMLTTQYRMHSSIMSFPSAELYEDKLTAAPSVAARLLKDLPYDVQDTEDTREPVVFWDTQGGDFPEKLETEDDSSSGKVSKSTLLGDSKCNDWEAALVKLHVGRLVEAGVKPEDIAVITPYNAQLALLSGLLKTEFVGIELGSIDGFQGREKEAVVVSLVRSNSEKEVGFLAEKRRLNVAMTRPKRHLCVIGDAETVGSRGGFLKSWMAWLEEHADLRYPDLAELGDQS